ncbi:MAG: hypothetical protein ACYDCJ_12970 [Gammaproteobacteria bacterium]
MSLDLTEPQHQELKHLVGTIAERHIAKTVKSMWLSVVGLGLMVVVQGFYIAYLSGTKVQELTNDTAELVVLENAKSYDENQLAAISATLIQMNAQLNRIENQTR